MLRNIKTSLYALLTSTVLFAIFMSYMFLLPVLAADRPEYGPGSAIYAHASVNHTRHGSGATSYHLYEPAEPKPISAPMVVFLHGLFGTMPSVYGKWIDHIARRGNIVVFPVYQSLLSGLSDLTFSRNALTAIKSAIGESSVTPELEYFALVGHSAGGFLAANLAAAANDPNSLIPVPKAVMCVAPGKSPIFRLRGMDNIDPGTLLLTIAGDRDMLVGTKDAKAIFNKTPQVLNRNFVLVNSSGFMVANHFAPLTFMCNNIDYCYWKLFDALCDAAFYGANREYCLGNTPEQCFMGNGKPPLTVTVP